MSEVVTKHISLEKDYIDKIQPYVERHNGNVSSAIREIIENAERSGLPRNTSVIDSHLLDWVLSDIDGILIPDNVLDEIVDPRLIHSMKDFEDYIDHRFKEFEWGVDISLKYDDNMSPSNVFIDIKGSYQKSRFVAHILSQLLIKNYIERNPLEIKSVNYSGGYAHIELSRSDKNMAANSLITFFGDMNETVITIKNRPDFWKSLVHRHAVSNYNMITIHRNFFEDILSGKSPTGEIMIETIAKRPIQDIPIKEMLSYVKDIYETSGIADRIDISDDSITVFHNFRDIQAVEKIKISLAFLLEAGGHLYDSRITSNTIVLKHRPDIGVKINQIVNNLKASNSSFDQQLVIFMTFIKGLKEIPDVPLYLTSLGRRIGKSLLQEYEKENNIKEWSLENFKIALENVDAKVHTHSEWKLEGNNLIYRVTKCNIATEGNTLDKCVCHTSREVFKGALDYAFGNNAELEVKKLLSHGDNYCEVIIKINNGATN
jgi:predicted hydrocarbon binding protein